MKQPTLLFSALFVASLVHAETPNLIFYDDFSNPSERDTGWETGIGPIQIPSEDIWGEDSFHNNGSYAHQSIRVVNTNSELYFGEPGRNYLEIWSDGWDDQSMWLVASDQFSEPSEVITIRMVYNHPGTGEVGPNLRPGIGNSVFNANRARQDIRFENGDFSGRQNVYTTGETHVMEIVYNNSADTVSYLDGQVDLISDAYDVWIDGVAVLRNHRYGSHENDVEIGMGLQSLAFVIFSNNRNHIRIDEIAVYGDAYIENAVEIPDPIDVNLLFADDFSVSAPGGIPDPEKWRYEGRSPNINPNDQDENRNVHQKYIETTESEAAAVFGEADNPYLRLSKQSPSGSLWVTAVNQFSIPSQVVTVSFDFYQPSTTAWGEANEGHDPRLRLGVNDPIASNAQRVPHELRFGEQAISGAMEAYSYDTRHSAVWVYNYSDEAVTYTEDETLTLEPFYYDVWVDGVRIIAGGGGPSDNSIFHGVTSEGVQEAADLTSIGFGAFGNQVTEFYIDNLLVRSGAWAPEGSGDGITFAEWTVAEGIPEGLRGPGDDPAGDGVANIVKFALGIPALEPARDRLPEMEIVSSEGNEFLALKFSRVLDRTGVQLGIEVSENLREWDEVVAQIEVLTDEGDGFQLVRIADVEAIAGHDRRFVRLLVRYDQ